MTDYAPLIVVTLVFGGVLIGFFWTKTPGWGQYTSALLLLLLVLYVTALAFAYSRVDWPSVSGILLAIAGYAAGLVSAKE